MNMLNPYWYEEFSAEDFKDALINADDEKLDKFENALSEERKRRKSLKAKSHELLEALHIVIENIEDEDFIVTYDECPVRFSRFDVKPNYHS